MYVFSRPQWEGGRYDGDENKRLDTLRLAMELGADYVDVELQVAFSGFSNPSKCGILIFIRRLNVISKSYCIFNSRQIHNTRQKQMVV